MLSGLFSVKFTTITSVTDKFSATDTNVRNNTNTLTDCGLTALSAQIGYIVPLKSMLKLKKWN